MQSNISLLKKFQLILYLTKHFKINLTAEKIASWLKQTNNRERQTKILQYPLQYIVYLLFRQQKPKKGSIQQRIIYLSENFSYTRKTLRLAHTIQSIADLENSLIEFKEIKQKLQQKDQNYSKNDLYICAVEISDCIMSAFNDLFDDMYFLGQLKLLSPKWQKIGEVYGSISWWISICLCLISCAYKANKSLKILHSNIKAKKQHKLQQQETTNTLEYNNEEQNKHQQAEQQQLQSEKQAINDVLQLLRFVFDFVNCSYDCVDALDIKSMKKFTENHPYIQNIVGFLGGVCQR